MCVVHVYIGTYTNRRLARKLFLVLRNVLVIYKLLSGCTLTRKLMTGGINIQSVYRIDINAIYSLMRMRF